MKNVLSIHRQGEGHWVGDGFPVHTVFHYQERPELSPFLLLDHAGPADFAPSDKARGVGWHPHRGFETVTVVLDGEVDHEDTAGNGGRIASGDVQWMTAGAGLLHKEMHSPEFTRRGGRFQALQLWVNLPAKSKMTPPRYQTLLARDVPVVSLPQDGGSVRVIAGGFGGAKGPARTFTAVNLLDVNLRAGHSVRLDLRDGFSGALYVLKGRIAVNRAARRLRTFRHEHAGRDPASLRRLAPRPAGQDSRTSEIGHENPSADQVEHLFLALDHHLGGKARIKAPKPSAISRAMRNTPTSSGVTDGS